MGMCLIKYLSCSLTGIGEIVLLPLDVLKIKRQTNPEAFRSRGFLRIVGDEGFSLYRGWGWTAARNAPGSFALFGGSAFTKEYLFGLEDFGKATWTQNFVASIGGAVASITVSAPLDVVKTRIQNANFESRTGGVTIIKEMIKHEGFSAFFKGLTPKVSGLLYLLLLQPLDAHLSAFFLFRSLSSDRSCTYATIKPAVTRFPLLNPHTSLQRLLLHRRSVSDPSVWQGMKALIGCRCVCVWMANR